MPRRKHPPTELRWPDPETGPWWARVHWQEIDGRTECVGLELWNGKGQDAQPITTTALRALPPDALIGEARRRYAQGLEQSVEALDSYLGMQNKTAGRGATKPSPFPPTRAVKSPTGSPQTRALRDRAGAVRRSPKAKARRGRPPGRKYPVDHWPKVAARYEEARRLGFNPTAEVAETFKVAHSTAAKWIARCREMDPPLLPPTTRGKARS